MCIWKNGLTAEELHAVDLRDERMCTHRVRRKRCCSKHWIRYHHIIRVADGGSNHPDNIATLCNFHHDLVHQLVMPLEGENSWLRSQHVKYGWFNGSANLVLTAIECIVYGIEARMNKSLLPATSLWSGQVGYPWRFHLSNCRTLGQIWFQLRLSPVRFCWSSKRIRLS